MTWEDRIMDPDDPGTERLLHDLAKEEAGIDRMSRVELLDLANRYDDLRRRREQQAASLTRLGLVLEGIHRAIRAQKGTDADA